MYVHSLLSDKKNSVIIDKIFVRIGSKASDGLLTNESIIQITTKNFIIRSNRGNNYKNILICSTLHG